MSAYPNPTNQNKNTRRNNFRSKRELVTACYKARLVLKRKRVTVDEMREAALVLNRAVRSLHSWLDTANQHRIWWNRDEIERIKRNRTPHTGPADQTVLCRQREIKMTAKEHKQRHQDLHAALDELFADFITHHPDKHNFTEMPILELINWSFRQTQKPDEANE